MVDQQLIVEGRVGRIDRWLAKRLPLSRSRLQALIRSGEITVDGKVVRPRHLLMGGECIDITLPAPEPSTLLAQDIPIEILHRDEHLMVVVKPSGMVVHPGRGHPDGTLVNALLPHLDGAGGDPERPGIVHRLDKGTSGVLVVARTPEALSGLAALFASHDIERRYLAVVWGRPPQLNETIDLPIGRHPQSRLKFAVAERGRRAVTRYSALHTQKVSGIGEVSLLRCQLETGRTHQIRVHLLHRGMGVVGDPMYVRRGGVPLLWKEALPPIPHQLLHAWTLGFVHPITKQHLRFSTPPPADFMAVLDCVKIPLPN